MESYINFVPLFNKIFLKTISFRNNFLQKQFSQETIFFLKIKFFLDKILKKPRDLGWMETHLIFVE